MGLRSIDEPLQSVWVYMYWKSISELKISIGKGLCGFTKDEET